MFCVNFPTWNEQTSFVEIFKWIFGSDYKRLWIGHYRVTLLNKGLRYYKPFPAALKEELCFSMVFFHSNLTRCSIHHICSLKTAVKNVCANISAVLAFKWYFTRYISGNTKLKEQTVLQKHLMNWWKSKPDQWHSFLFTNSAKVTSRTVFPKNIFLLFL